MNRAHSKVFISGFLRSGTTLMEKLLHNHPQVSIGAQPFPFLYYRLKELFLESLHIVRRRYPLGTLFLEKAYTGEQFKTFLEKYVVPAEDVLESLEQMKGYSGQLSPALIDSPGRIDSAPLAEIYRALTRRLADLYGKSDVRIAGAKEVFCEEYIPYFLDRGIKVVNVIRDPRDMVASVNFGKGGEYTGNLPTIYLLQKWRKSVAFSLCFEPHSDFISVRYEDLVQAPWETLDRLTDFLGIDAFSRQTFMRGILDQSGNLWKGNSSFKSYEFISDESSGKFEAVLDDTTVRFIENICFPEMKVMNYEPHFCTGGLQHEEISAFMDPVCQMTAAELETFGLSPNYLENEVERFELLRSELDDSRATLWFIYPEVYRRLRRTVRF